MANSRIGQYALEYQLSGFTTPTRSHVVRLWIAPVGSPAIGTPAASITVQKLGGATASLQAVADQAWSYLRLSWSTAIAASGFSLWKYVTENSREYISGGTLATPLGTGATVTAAHQVTLTFRHAGGGIGKIVLLETGNAGDQQTALTANAAGTVNQRIAAYVMSADSPMVALDNTFPITPLRQSFGQNEALWRKLYRGA